MEGGGSGRGQGHQRLTSVSLFSPQIPAIPAALAMLPMPLGHRAALARLCLSSVPLNHSLVLLSAGRGVRNPL